MRSATSEPMQALLARFQEIVEAEQDRLRVANLAVEEIETALRRAREAQRVAAARHGEAAATYAAVQGYVGGQSKEPGVGALGEGGASPSGSSSTASGAGHTPPGRAVQHLIVDVMDIGQVIPLAVIYDGVRRLRPGTTNSAIRSALSILHKTGAVENVRRSVYRLLKIPEDYKPKTT
ncbi:hypothetical protein ACIG0A_22055 [Streptomyces californicus]|uniref:hypothetical protein n=1 Tax=Streptomyces californicus TaxID=67351 RepID=UPI0037D26557